MKKNRFSTRGKLPMKSTTMAVYGEDMKEMRMGELFDTQCNAVDIELINLVKKRPALYDIRVPQKDRTKSAREALWDEVCKCMQKKLKPLAAEMRWKYLRENYIKARKKQKLKEELAEQTGQPLKLNKYNRKYAYRYYEQMSFLDDALDHQKMVTAKKTTKQNRRSKRNSQQTDTQPIALQDEMESSMSNDNEESAMGNDALFDYQYETVDVTIPNNETDLSFNSSNTEVQHQNGSSLNSTIKSNHESNMTYEQLLFNYLQRTNEKPSPIDGFLARLGEGLKRLPYRERSKLELEFLTRLRTIPCYYDQLGGCG